MRKDAETFFLADFDPDEDYDDAIAAVAAQWPCDWGVYWGLESSQPPRYLGEENWTAAQDLNRQAQRLVRAASRLSRRKLPEDRRTLPEWLSSESARERELFDELAGNLRRDLTTEQLAEPKWDQILRAVEGETPAQRRERFFVNAVQIHAFQEFGYSPDGIARRLLALLGFLVRTRSALAQTFLQRVARCYVLDLRAEVSIMSRAVMESALQGLEIEPVASEIAEIRGKRHPSLVDWMDAASKAGVLDEKGRIAAEAVRTAGDDSVHVSPELAPDPDMVLADLVRVLEQIEAYGGR